MAGADVEQKLMKQIEFYFSDSNFRNDKFLRAKAAENSDGYVPLQVLTTFNRVKSTTTDVEVIAKALEGSTTLELSTDRTAVRRTKPLPEDDDSQQRSVYVKAPFPVDAKLESLQAFAEQFGSVNRVVMRRTKNREKLFKGSIFIEYPSAAEGEALLAAHAKGECLYEGKPVEKVCRMQAYFDSKKSEREEKRLTRAADKGKGAAGGGAGEGSSGKGKKEDPAASFKKELTPGLIVRVSNAGPNANVNTIAEFLNTAGDGELKFAEYDPATKVAYGRFATPAIATKACAALLAGTEECSKAVDGTPSATAAEGKVHVTVLTGEEEKTYWERVWELQLAKFTARRTQGGGGRGSGRGGRGGRGGGRGGGGRGGGQKRSRDSNGGDGGDRAAKKANTSDE